MDEQINNLSRLEAMALMAQLVKTLPYCTGNHPSLGCERERLLRAYDLGIAAVRGKTANDKERRINK